MEIEFAFRKESSGLFGFIGRPVARLIVIRRRRRVPQLFYVDSGADITPHSEVRWRSPRINIGFTPRDSRDQRDRRTGSA
jgi:antitoxin (DNA-binding transcriptional repressor) of toxin-antitoxin stability system